jgi:hypothetical protein
VEHCGVVPVTRLIRVKVTPVIPDAFPPPTGVDTKSVMPGTAGLGISARVAPSAVLLGPKTAASDGSVMFEVAGVAQPEAFGVAL